jgi:hypothetical protein
MLPAGFARDPPVEPLQEALGSFRERGGRGDDLDHLGDGRIVSHGAPSSDTESEAYGTPRDRTLMTGRRPSPTERHGPVPTGVKTNPSGEDAHFPVPEGRGGLGSGGDAAGAWSLGDAETPPWSPRRFPR